MAHFFTFTPRKRAASDIDFIHLIENTGMKILVATEKPFAKKAVPKKTKTGNYKL